MLQAVWVEIPVKNLERALDFYRAVFGLEATEIADDGVRRTTTLYMGNAEGAAGISLNQTQDFEPSDRGTLVYLYNGEDIDTVLPRVEPAGGKVTSGKTSMGQAGYLALVVDTEGNTLALYNM